MAVIVIMVSFAAGAASALSVCAMSFSSMRHAHAPEAARQSPDSGEQVCRVVPVRRDNRPGTVVITTDNERNTS